MCRYWHNDFSNTCGHEKYSLHFLCHLTVQTTGLCPEAEVIGHTNYGNGNWKALRCMDCSRNLVERWHNERLRRRPLNPGWQPREVVGKMMIPADGSVESQRILRAFGYLETSEVRVSAILPPLRPSSPRPQPLASSSTCFS